MLAADAGVTRSTRRRVDSAGLATPAGAAAAPGRLPSPTAVAVAWLVRAASGAVAGPADGRAGAAPAGRRLAVRCFCFLVFLAMYSREA
jgi:hypothetical protein